MALLVLFWFYLACFCAVYKNTQIYLIKDTLISFGTSMIYPFGLYFFPVIFRMNALKRKNKDCMYNFSKILQMIWVIRYDNSEECHALEIKNLNNFKLLILKKKNNMIIY